MIQAKVERIAPIYAVVLSVNWGFAVVITTNSTLFSVIVSSIDCFKQFNASFSASCKLISLSCDSLRIFWIPSYPVPMHAAWYSIIVPEGSACVIQNQTYIISHMYLIRLRFYYWDSFFFLIVIIILFCTNKNNFIPVLKSLGPDSSTPAISNATPKGLGFERKETRKKN